LTTSVPDQQAVGIRLVLIASKTMWKKKKLKAEGFWILPPDKDDGIDRV
jgi:hypothetical protein